MRDVPLLVTHRRSMWESIANAPQRAANGFDRVDSEWLRREMRRGRIAAFVAESHEGAAGSVVTWIRDVGPSPENNEGKAPFLSTLFVDPGHRRRGVATRLLREAVKWCRAGGFPYVTGIPVGYAPKVLRRLGFLPLRPEWGREFGRKRQV